MDDQLVKLTPLITWAFEDSHKQKGEERTATVKSGLSLIEMLFEEYHCTYPMHRCFVSADGEFGEIVKTMPQIGTILAEDGVGAIITTYGVQQKMAIDEAHLYKDHEENRWMTKRRYLEIMKPIVGDLEL